MLCWYILSHAKWCVQESLVDNSSAVERRCLINRLTLWEIHLLAEFDEKTTALMTVWEIYKDNQLPVSLACRATTGKQLTWFKGRKSNYYQYKPYINQSVKEHSVVLWGVMCLHPSHSTGRYESDLAKKKQIKIFPKMPNFCSHRTMWGKVLQIPEIHKYHCLVCKKYLLQASWTYLKCWCLKSQ